MHPESGDAQSNHMVYRHEINNSSSIAYTWSSCSRACRNMSGRYDNCGVPRTMHPSLRRRFLHLPPHLRPTPRQQRESSVRQVRNHIEPYAHDAIRSTPHYAERLTRRQLSELPVLAHYRHRKTLEFIISESMFRDEVCRGAESPQLVLEHLRTAGLLNTGKDGELYVWRMLAKPLGSALVVSIKPAIREFRTKYEKGRDKQRKESLERRRQFKKRPIKFVPERRRQPKKKSPPTNIVPLFG